MNGVQIIFTSLEFGKQCLLELLNDMKDAPLTYPTSKGGNHPLWVLGHITYSEACIIDEIMLGEEHPFPEWKEIFDIGSEPIDDPSHYPAFDEVLHRFEEVRNRTLTILETLTDDDLEQESKGCPEEYQDMFGTYGKCFVQLTLHPMMHHGQVADARRMAGRRKLVA